MNVLFLFRGKTQKRILEKSDEKGPFDFLYGYSHFSMPKSYVITPRGDFNTFSEKVFYLIQKPFSMIVKLGFPLEIFFLFRKSIKNSSHIFCINDAIGLSMAFYKMLGFIDAKVIVIMQSLPERFKYFRWNKPLIWLLSRMLNSTDSVLTLTEYAQKPLREAFTVDSSLLSSFFFGVDTDYWFSDPCIQRENFILSVGNDMNRDYKSLVSALPEDLPLKIVTNMKIDTQNKNVEILNGIPDSELRNLYQICLFTVIPSEKIEYESSGLSCILQAMACRSPVIASYAPTHNELFSDGENIVFYKPEDTDDLYEKIIKLQNNNEIRQKLSYAGQKITKGIYNTRNMACQLEKIIENM